MELRQHMTQSAFFKMAASPLPARHHTCKCQAAAVESFVQGSAARAEQGFRDLRISCDAHRDFIMQL